MQALRYTYDPVGNITQIRDDAQQAIFFNNQVVEPHAQYAYDALYRLIAAEGREHAGQAAQPQTTWNDEFRIGLAHPHDGGAMRRYDERYEYDAVGNILALVHRAKAGRWTRRYEYDDAISSQPGMVNNRLSRTVVGGVIDRYDHDAHGNMTAMPHLSVMRWNHLDQLTATARQAVSSGTPETTYYTYDAAGRRVRKVTERQAAQDATATRLKERVYLGGFEVYREYNGGGVGVTLERETLHVVDGQQRVALVETRTLGDDGSAPQLVRYQLGNHLGSASLELDGEGEVISYEENYAYGSTSYQGVDAALRAAAKRYRYTGKERDEETGLSYHGARYYATWLGRWTSADPIGIEDGLNVYEYVGGRPTAATDPTGTQSAEEDWDWGYVGDLASKAWEAATDYGREPMNDWLVSNSPFSGVAEALSDVSAGDVAGNSDYYVEKTFEGAWSYVENIVSLAGAGLNPAEAPAARLGPTRAPGALGNGLRATMKSTSQDVERSARRHIGAAGDGDNLCVASVCADVANGLLPPGQNPLTKFDVVRAFGREVSAHENPISTPGDAQHFADTAFRTLYSEGRVDRPVTLTRANDAANPPGIYMVIRRYHAMRADISSHVLKVQSWYRGKMIDQDTAADFRGSVDDRR